MGPSLALIPPILFQFPAFPSSALAPVGSQPSGGWSWASFWSQLLSASGPQVAAGVGQPGFWLRRSPWELPPWGLRQGLGGQEHARGPVYCGTRARCRPGGEVQGDSGQFLPSVLRQGLVWMVIVRHCSGGAC